MRCKVQDLSRDLAHILAIGNDVLLLECEDACNPAVARNEKGCTRRKSLSRTHAKRLTSGVHYKDIGTRKNIQKIAMRHLTHHTAAATTNGIAELVILRIGIPKDKQLNTMSLFLQKCNRLGNDLISFNRPSAATNRNFNDVAASHMFMPVKRLNAQIKPSHLACDIRLRHT